MAGIGPGGPSGEGGAPPSDPGAAASGSVSTTMAAVGGGGWAVGVAAVAIVLGALWLTVGPAPTPEHTTHSTAPAATPAAVTPISAPSTPTAALDPLDGAVEAAPSQEQPAVAPARPTPPPAARAAKARPTAQPDVPEAPEPAAPSSLVREQRLLSEARGALRAGDFAATARGIARHRQDFPNGQLAEAREVLGIQLLVRQGRTDDARAATRRFRARFPQSLMGPASKTRSKPPWRSPDDRGAYALPVDPAGRRRLPGPVRG